jgi:guanine deaminase
VILTGHLLLPHPEHGAHLARGQVRIVGDRIAEVGVGPDRLLGTPDLGSDNWLISPGFVDTHLHLPQFDCIGVDGLPLLEWLDKAVFPAEARWADPDHAGQATTRAIGRMLAAGTTGIASYATVHHRGALAARDALHGSGMRAIVGQVLMDQESPPELMRPAAQLLAEANTFIGRGRVEVAVTPRFAISCSRELLAGCGKLVAGTGWPVQTHLSETLQECGRVRELHGLDSYTDVYRSAGLLTPRTILGHGIWLNDQERIWLRESRSVVAHCPGANLFLQAGSMNRAAHLSSGVRLGLGSDVAGGPDVCMVRVARAMIETAKSRRMADGCTAVPTPSEAWGQITWKNAAALGWEGSGVIRAGNCADLVVIDPGRGPGAQADWAHAPDPLSLLLYAWDDRWVAKTIVGGRVAYSA